MSELLVSAHGPVPVAALVLAALAGAVMGAVFFGGLWWTARCGAASSRPALWFFVSLLLRMGVVLSGFYAVGGGDWERMLTCLLGFVLARVVVMRLTRRPGGASSAQEIRHAP